MRLSLCLSVREDISGTTMRDLYEVFVHAVYGCGSVLLRRRRDTLCTSGFVNDIIFFHKWPYSAI